MKIRPVYNFKWLPSSIAAITLYPFILFKQPRENVEMTLIVHEATHVLQIIRKGWFYFYISYGWYYVLNRFRGMSHWNAYLNIPYEIEARHNEELWDRNINPDFDLHYLVTKVNKA